MKRLFIMILMLGYIAQNMIAEIRYNPINDMWYTYPESPDINPQEYIMLLLGCIGIKDRMMRINGGIQPHSKDILNQYSVYLLSVGTPTALRLMADLKSNTINYADGSFMKKIFA